MHQQQWKSLPNGRQQNPRGRCAKRAAPLGRRRRRRLVVFGALLDPDGPPTPYGNVSLISLLQFLKGGPPGYTASRLAKADHGRPAMSQGRPRPALGIRLFINLVQELVLGGGEGGPPPQACGNAQYWKGWGRWRPSHYQYCGGRAGQPAGGKTMFLLLSPHCSFPGHRAHPISNFEFD